MHIFKTPISETNLHFLILQLSPPPIFTISIPQAQTKIKAIGAVCEEKEKNKPPFVGPCALQKEEGKPPFLGRPCTCFQSQIRRQTSIFRPGRTFFQKRKRRQTSIFKARPYMLSRKKEKNTYMGREKKKIKVEPENDLLERRMDALEKIQGLVRFNKLELFEKELIEQQRHNEKIKDVKTEERTICGENRTLIAYLNNKVSELKNLVLEKDHVLGAYQNRLQNVEAKAAEMEKEIEELNKRKWVDNQIMKELRNQLSESQLMAEKLRENNTKASQTVDELRRRMSTCQEEKKKSDRIQEEMRRKESETLRLVEELRRHNMESDHANEVMANELLIANDKVEELNRAVKKLKERNLEAHKASEVHKKRFENMVSMAEDLTSLIKMNVEDLEKFRNTLVGDGGVSSPPVATKRNDSPEKKGSHASKALDFRNSARMQSTKKRNGLGTIEIIDCDDDDDGTDMICEKYVSNLSPIKIRCSEVSPTVRRRKRNKVGDGMVRAFEEDDQLCMHAVCELYRQHISASGSTQGSSRLLYHFEALRGCELAEYLIDGDPELRLTKSIGEVRRQFPDVIEKCRRLAADYSSYFFIATDKHLPLSLSLVCCPVICSHTHADACEVCVVEEVEDTDITLKSVVSMGNGEREADWITEESVKNEGI
ncbi:hypothetical protein OROGR_026882 [Orobanche gracilis]